jgi:hypothetical protein
MPRDGAVVAPATMAQIQTELAELRRGHALLLGAIEKRRAALSNAPETTAPSEQDNSQESASADRRARGDPESLSDPASTRCAWIVALMLALVSVVGPALIGFISQLRGPAPPPPNAYPSFASYTAAQQMQAQKQQQAVPSSSAERRAPPVLHVRRERIRRPVESVDAKFSHGFQLRTTSRTRSMARSRSRLSCP